MRLSVYRRMERGTGDGDVSREQRQCWQAEKQTVVKYARRDVYWKIEVIHGSWMRYGQCVCYRYSTGGEVDGRRVGVDKR